MLLFFSFYYHNTSFNSDIKIVSKADNIIVIITPLNSKIEYSNKAGDTLLIYKRPVKEIYFSDSISGKSELNISLEHISNESADCNIEYNKTIIGIFEFFKEIRLHLVLYAFLLVWIICFFLVNKLRIQSIINLNIYRLLKYIIRNKPAKTPVLNTTNDNLSKFSVKPVFIVLIILYALSIFIGIGSYNIQQHESGKWRALVALEMKYSGDYVTPTLNGEKYYNKPPLFNYLLIPFVDSENDLELKLRSINIICIVLLLLTSFLVFRKQLNKQQARFALLVFAFSPLLFFKSSMFLNLDPFFSLLIVILFYLNYVGFNNSKVLRMFVGGYLITALAFLTKGYPALFFQLASLLSLSLVYKKFKILISWKHFIGLLGFFVVLGFYVFFYLSVNPDVDWLVHLMGDVKYKLDIGIARNLENFISFWGKSIIAFPVLFFMPFVLSKENLYFIFKNKFDAYCTILFIIGCLPFLFGDYYQQYILMLIPFIIIPIVRYLGSYTGIARKWVYSFLIFNIIVLIISILVNHFSMAFTGIISILIVVLFTVYLFKPSKMFSIWLLFFGVLLIARPIFTYTTIWKDNEDYSNIKEDAENLINKIESKELFLYPDRENINYATMYYLSYYYKNIISIDYTLVNNEHFFLSLEENIPSNALIIDSIAQQISYKHPDPYGLYHKNSTLYLFKIKDSN
ncbi:MAG TPA: glycosyltransferase family 39 protein [Bacteroidales bacterium]|nr:glycosyltransferase family 39 protein [Bacteroidales bacterium]